jgi:hypothetical protein
MRNARILAALSLAAIALATPPVLDGTHQNLAAQG